MTKGESLRLRSAVAGSQAPPAHAGVDPAAACRDAKAEAAGKQAGDMLKALAKDAKKPDSVKLIQSVSNESMGDWQ